MINFLNFNNELFVFFYKSQLESINSIYTSNFILFFSNYANEILSD